MQYQSELLHYCFIIARFMKNPIVISKDLQITPIQLQTLIYLKNHEKAQMSEIATYFGVELPSVTSLVTKLITLKYVTRTLDKKDKRLARIHLTRTGNSVMERAVEQRTKTIAKALKTLNVTDREELLRTMKLFIDGLEEAQIP